MLSAPNKKKQRYSRIPIAMRLAGFFCLTFILGLGFTLTVTYLKIEYSLEKSSQEVITAKLREASSLLSETGVAGLEKSLATDQNRALDAHFLIRVIDRGGRTVFLKPSVQEKHFDFDGLLKQNSDPASALGWHALSAINDEDKFDLLTEKAGDAYFLQVGRSSEDREAVLENLVSAFAVVGGAFFILSGGVGLWYARRSLAPLRDLLATMKIIEEGDLTERVAVRGAKDELSELGQTFNRMINRIDLLVQVMRESLDNVAHDIRTPLARLRSVAEDGLLSPDSSILRSALEDCAESANGISSWVDQLLSISEAEAGTLTLRLENSRVENVIQEVVEAYEFVAHDKQMTIATEIDPSLSWPFDPKRIQQAIANLLDNAIKFSPEGANTLVSAHVRDEKLEIAVRDQGCGISENDLPRIWNRLFRGDKSRSTRGSGLGLAIVRATALAHRGEFEARPNVEAGMTFWISLPK